jgi:hypothetical protein
VWVKPDRCATVEAQIDELDAIIRLVWASVFSLDRRPVDP